MIHEKVFEAGMFETDFQFRSLFFAMSEGVAVHQLLYANDGRARDYRIVRVNPAFERHTGIASKSIEGRLASEAYGTGTPPYLDIYEGTVRTGRPASFEAYFHPLQKHFRISVCPPEKDCFATIFSDITNVKIAEEEHSRLSAIVRSASDGIISKSLDWKVLTWNEGAERIYGYSEAEMRGQTACLVVPEDRMEELRRLQDQIADGLKVSAFETVRVRKNGQRFPVSLTVSPIQDGTGMVIGASTIVRDITQQKELEADLQRARKLEAIGRLAGGVAHEINTPTQYVTDNTRFVQDSLGSLKSAFKVLLQVQDAARKQALSPELLNSCDAALEASEFAYLFSEMPVAIEQSLEGLGRITKIVKGIKDFAQPSQSEKCLADINQVIRTIVTVASHEWKFVARIELDLDSDLPLVPCFVSDLNQVILNLVVNASQAIREVQSKAATLGTITLRTRTKENRIEVQVCDTGAGIPEEIQPRIFEPFFTTRDIGKGTGQGLSFVYRTMVERHGGSVRFETELGKGTTFYLTVPLSC